VALLEVGGVVAEELHGSRRSMSVRPLAMRRSSSTERISEPSCSFWLRFCATSLLLRSRATRPAARWNRLTAAHSGSSRFEAGVLQRGDQSVEDVGDGAADGGGLGERSRIGLVLKRTPAVELKLGENVCGRG